MNFFVNEIVTPPSKLPITASDTDLAAAVVDEIERTVLWRAVVSQTRKIEIDGPLPSCIEIEPTTDIVSLTRWTPTDDAVVVDADSYQVVSRDPFGTILTPAAGMYWPKPERAIGSFALTYSCGWEVTDVANSVPSSVQLMVERAVAFRAGSGLAGFSIGSVKIDVADSYSTDALPREITNIARGWAYHPGIFAARA